MQALYMLALSPVAETLGDPNSYGFRIERSTADAMAQLFVCLSQKVSAQWVLDADIEGFFDNINHEWLLRNAPTDVRMLRQWLKAGVIHKGQLHATDAGTPQGDHFPRVGKSGTRWSGNTPQATPRSDKGEKAEGECGAIRRRLRDHGSLPEVLENEVKPWVEQFLVARGLRLSPKKTRIAHIDEGFDFLGWNFRKYDGTLLIKPSKRTSRRSIARSGKQSTPIRRVSRKI